MRITNESLQNILLKANKAKQEELDKLVEEARKSNQPLQDLVVKKQIITDKELTKLYAEEIGVPFVELDSKEIDKSVLKLIPERIARKYKAVLYAQKGEKKMLAMSDPEDLQAIDFLEKQLGKDLVVHIATDKDISSALDQYKGSISSELDAVIQPDDAEEAEEEVSEEDLAEDSPIAQTVNLLIEYAIKARASDIHIEPREGYLQVRYRVDGVLREANKLPRKVMAALVSRIKILSNLKIDEHRAPQDGRFKISFGEQLYALRVSTLPVVDGEKVVMRILNESARALGLEDLGFWGKSLESIHDAIAQPYGIVLVTGPTGSGKSTTLYSILNLLNSPGVNISTIEDPVEYRIPGVNQTQVNVKAGMTFANGLRALLRQDPNIIMVGEIRDGETADLAIQAALTGHLVFATLHTNNAATAIPRLLDMGAEPFLIASTVRAVVGQRLVRKLSRDCREAYTPNEAEMEEIKKTFAVKEALEQAAQAQKEQHEHKRKMAANKKKVINPLPKSDDDILKRLKKDPNIVEGDSKSDSKQNGGEEKDAKSKDEKIEKLEIPKSESKLQLWRPKTGDDKCEGTGYSGRIGIYEVLYVSDEVQKLIVANSTSDNIQDQAIKEGMLTMQQDGFIKVLQGQTSLEEVMRVTRE